MKCSACQMIYKAAAFVAIACSTAHGAIFSETWEIPAIAAGTTSTSLPSPWIQFNGTPSEAVIFHPNSTSVFHAVEPLASPAGGSQSLRLAGLNTGVYRVTDVGILANTTYTYTVAIGNDVQSAVRNDSWAIALWADVNGNGFFDGVGNTDVFIGQQFGTNVVGSLPINPAAGEWVNNTFTFDSATTPALVGKHIIAFLNNFLSDGASYYDNVTLTATTDQAAVPEPTSMLLWLGAAAAALAPRLRKSKERNPKRRPGGTVGRNGKPHLERLEDRLALSGFGPEDGSYILEPSPVSYQSVSVLSGDRIVAAASGNGIVGRYDSQGNLDTTFGSGGLTPSGTRSGTNGAGDPLSVQADGRLVMAGGGFKMNTARLNANGSPDSTYGTGGVSASLDITPSGTYAGTDVAFVSGIQSNGKIVVAGYTGTAATTGYSAVVARFTTSGAVDSGKGGFGQSIQGKPAGYTASSFGGKYNEFLGLAVQPDDKIVAVGYLDTTGNGDDRLVVARYTASGVLDKTFHGTGYSVFLPQGIADTKAYAVSIQTDGKIDVSGYAAGADGTRDLLLARYNTNGTLDGGFGGGKGYVTFDVDASASQTDERATSLVVQPDGKIVAAGYVYHGTLQTAQNDKNVLVARFNTDGTLDNGFGTGGFKIGSAPLGHTQWGFGVALESDGTIIVGGRDIDQSGTQNALLMRFDGHNAPPATSATTNTAATDAALLLLMTDDPLTSTKRK